MTVMPWFRIEETAHTEHNSLPRVREKKTLHEKSQGKKPQNFKMQCMKNKNYSYVKFIISTLYSITKDSKLVLLENK